MIDRRLLAENMQVCVFHSAASHFILSLSVLRGRCSGVKQDGGVQMFLLNPSSCSTVCRQGIDQSFISYHSRNVRWFILSVYPSSSTHLLLFTLTPISFSNTINHNDDDVS